MAEWKRICCPVDFSLASRVAMEEAARLAARHGADLVLLHVDDRPRPPAAGDTLAWPPEVLERGGLEVERQLGEWTVEAAALAGRAVEQAIRAGDAAEEIVRFAAQGGFDAVVTGTHGRAELEHLAFGSVAEAVVRNAPCTVVVVRARAARGSEGRTS
jgi:universal stress protein A